MRWSKWLESMRKDVKCTFGILKGRFWTLKNGTRIHSINSVDKIWCTCCALHNIFLEHDGLHVNWQQGVESDWKGALGEFKKGYQYNHSGMGPGNNIQNIENVMDIDEEGEPQPDNHPFQARRDVRSGSTKFFREKQFEHFNILFEKKK
jgi:Plant transposon protein